ncbi:MAG: hypothetical protein [Bacteriophage sp.]|nr:MAG: hypothetical protein [Bacteriophage sp.]
MPCKFFSIIYIYIRSIFIYIYYILKSAKDIAGNITINDDKTSYTSELTTTHLVKQDDVGMTVVIGIDTDIGHGDLLL